MAILKEEENSGQEQQAQQADGPQGVATGGGSRISSFSSGSQAPTQSSGRFTNIKKYVDANRGAGEQLGNRITSGVEKNTNKATDQTQAQQIAQNVQAERDRIGQGNTFNDRIKNDEARQIYGNEGEKKEFSNLLNQRNELANLGTAKNTAEQQQLAAIQKAQGDVANLGTESGRFQLLQNTVRNPNYSTGQQRLDQLVLQAGNPQQLVDAQRNLGQQIKTSSGQLQDLYGNIGTNLQTGSTEANTISNLLKNTLGTTTGNLVTAQGEKATNLNTQNTQQNAALERILSGNALAGDFDTVNNIMSSGGLNSGMRTFNTLAGDKWKNYYQAGDTNLTGQNVISSDDFGRYSALRGLAEQGLTDFTQAGGNYNTSGLKGNLSGDINTAQNALLNQLNRQDTLKNQFTTASGNLLDLLKYQEGNSTPGTINSSIGSGASVPLTLDSTNMPGTILGNKGAVGAYDSSIFNNPANLGEIGGKSLYADIMPYLGGSEQTLKQFIDRYKKELNDAGYNSGLGGAPASGNITSK